MILEVISGEIQKLGQSERARYMNRSEDILGWRAGGTVSNMSVSMLAWIAQLDDVSLRAVTRIEYRCATVTVSRSIGNSSTSVFTEKACQQVSIW